MTDRKVTVNEADPLYRKWHPGWESPNEAARKERVMADRKKAAQGWWLAMTDAERDAIYCAYLDAEGL